MKRSITIPLIIIALFLHSMAIAQDSLRYRKLSLNVTELLFLDTRLTYTWQQNENHAYSLTLGYRPKSTNNIYNSRGWIFKPSINTPANYAGAAANIYYVGMGWHPQGKRKLKFSIELFYKYIRTGEYLFGYMTSSYGFQYYLDDFQAHVVGIKVLFETKMVRVFSGPETEGTISYFFGFGARVNQTIRTTLAKAYSSWESPGDIVSMKRKTNPTTQKEYHLLPSIQMGFKFNVIWNKQQELKFNLRP